MKKFQLISIWKLGFVLNENIEWHSMQIELNSNALNENLIDFQFK